MKVTNKSVIIETTNTMHGHLERGGVCGRIDRYPLADVITATGLNRGALAGSNECDLCPGYECTIREVIKYNVRGTCVRRGAVIQ